MGYQVLELRGVALRPEHVVVANAAQALEVARGRLAVREGVERATLDRIASVLTRAVDQATFRVLGRQAAVAAQALESRGTVGPAPASDARLELSEAEERFLRYSAYPDDVRIRSDGSVRPGTYVTTHADGMAHVSTGIDAVRRYALPNREPAVHRYYLEPPSRIEVRRGIVQPAYGQPGGGVEVIFENGAAAGTKQKQDQIPPR